MLVSLSHKRLAAAARKEAAKAGELREALIEKAASDDDPDRSQILVRLAGAYGNLAQHLQDVAQRHELAAMKE